LTFALNPLIVFQPAYMKTLLTVTFTLIFSHGVMQADLLDALGFGKKATNTTSALPAALTASLSQDQVVQGLKEALGKGVQQAVSRLGHEGVFFDQCKREDPDAREAAHRGQDPARSQAG
jgi:hypothetical protein